MNKLLQVVLFVTLTCGCFSTNAQSTYAVNCTMTVEEVLQTQWFDIDDPIAEKAKYITEDLFVTLDMLYSKLNVSASAIVDTEIVAIQELLDDAEELEMNLSMFDEDIEFVESL